MTTTARKTTGGRTPDWAEEATCQSCDGALRSHDPLVCRISTVELAALRYQITLADQRYDLWRKGCMRPWRPPSVVTEFFRRVWLFAGIVGRRYEQQRLGIRLSWQIADPFGTRSRRMGRQ